MGRRLTRKRNAVIATTTAAVLLGGACAASAADGPPGDPDGAPKSFPVQSISASLWIDPNSTLTSLVDVKELTGLVDQAGKVIGSLTVRPITLPVAYHAAGISDYSCVKNGTSSDFIAYQPTEIFLSDGKSVQQHQFHVYRKDNARRVRRHDIQYSTQFEVCATGGAQPRSERATQIGLGMAFPDTNQTYKIGQDWREGQTPANYTSTLGFQLGPAEKVPLSISGSISQHPSDQLMGSITGPFPTPGDAYARNAVNSWWQASCQDSFHGCRWWWRGSKDFHGTVAQGLWEFTPDQVRGVNHFEVRSYIKY